MYSNTQIMVLITRKVSFRVFVGVTRQKREERKKWLHLLRRQEVSKVQRKSNSKVPRRRSRPGLRVCGVDQLTAQRKIDDDTRQRKFSERDENAMPMCVEGSEKSCLFRCWVLCVCVCFLCHNRKKSDFLR